MKKILQYLFEHKTLSKEQAKEVLVNIGKGNYNEHEVTAFMTVYLMRSITIEELQGFRDALLELCVKADLNDYDDEERSPQKAPSTRHEIFDEVTIITHSLVLCLVLFCHFATTLYSCLSTY